MAIKTNAEKVAASEKKRRDRGQAKIPVWVPNTEEAKAKLRTFAAELCTDFADTPPLSKSPILTVAQIEAARAALDDQAADLLTRFVLLVQAGDNDILRRLGERLALTEDMLKLKRG